MHYNIALVMKISKVRQLTSADTYILHRNKNCLSLQDELEIVDILLGSLENYKLIFLIAVVSYSLAL